MQQRFRVAQFSIGQAPTRVWVIDDAAEVGLMVSAPAGDDELVYAATAAEMLNGAAELVDALRLAHEEIHHPGAAAYEGKDVVAIIHAALARFAPARKPEPCNG